MLNPAPRGRLTPRLIDSLYTEAMLLADESRGYYERQGREERLALDPVLRVGFSCESLKVTTRVMHIIAWLLNQRAIEAGEARHGRCDGRRLGPSPVSDIAALAGLPATALQLIEASCDLYARVRRLDETSEAGEPQPSPARSLLSRLERSF